MSFSVPAWARRKANSGADGLSAYDIAVAEGFVGDEAAWLLSLKGDDGIDGANGANGADGLDGSNGSDGLSAYEVAVLNGFIGTEVEWLASLQGPAGSDGAAGADGVDGSPGADGSEGASAYEIAVANGFVGDEAAWLASLAGSAGPAGADGADGADGANGTDGADGLSAYEVAVANGFVGTESDWLTSLVGPTGADGPAGADGTDAPLIPVQILAAPDKATPIDADTFGYLDSANSDSLVKFTWANIKAALLLYFEGLFRLKLSATRTYYVRTDGNDGNTGLVNNSGGAFLTIQHAVDVATALDNNGYDIFIQLGNGTYNQSVVLKAYIGSGKLNLVGNTGSPGSCIINAVGANTIYGEDAGTWRIGGLRLLSSGGTCVYGRGATQITINYNMEYGAAARHIFAFLGAAISIEANWYVNGNCPIHVHASYGGRVLSAYRTCTLAGFPNFSTAFAYGQDLGAIQLFGVTFAGTTGSGPRYIVIGNSVIQTGSAGATYLPGNVAGASASGGQYL